MTVRDVIILVGRVVSQLTLDQIINILVGTINLFGVSFTLVVLYMTWREMEKQRREAYKPELVIPKIDVYAYGSRHDFIFRKTLWTNEMLPEGKIPTNSFHAAPNIFLYNLGVGAAKDINLRWVFDVKSNLKRTQNCFDIRAVSVEIDPEYFEIGFNFPIMKVRHEGQSVRFGLNDLREQQYSYKLPASVDQKGLEASIPSGYLWFVSLLTASQVGASQLPPLGLHLTYTDIGGHHYSKKFRGEILPSISNWHLPETRTDEPALIGQLELKEVNSDEPEFIRSLEFVEKENILIDQLLEGDIWALAQPNWIDEIKSR